MSTETVADLAAAQAAFVARIEEQRAYAEGYAQHLPSDEVGALTLAAVPRYRSRGILAFARGLAPEVVGWQFLVLSHRAAGAKVLCYADTPVDAADEALGVMWAQRRFSQAAYED